MALVDDSLESLGSARLRIFSTLDLESGHWLCDLDSKAKPLCAFLTHDGLYEFQRLPFGLKKAPATFSQLMVSVLQGLIWKICLVFLDDVIVYSQDFQGHLQGLGTVFDRLRQANLQLKPKKCEFGKETIRFLEHYVSSEGIEPLPETCQVVKVFPTPTNLKECRSLLGLTGFY